MPLFNTTFRSYTSGEAARYATFRQSYPRALYEEIFGYHERTGGYMEKSFDVGCGPGNATRDLALHFQHATGVDPWEQMVVTARCQGGVTVAGEEIQHAVAGAEDLVNVVGVEKASVDLSPLL